MKKHKCPNCNYVLEYAQDKAVSSMDGSVRDDLIRLAAKMLMNRGNYPIHPENQQFKMSQRAWREMENQHKKGDEFFRQIGIELRALADRLPNDGVSLPASKRRKNDGRFRDRLQCLVMCRFAQSSLM